MVSFTGYLKSRADISTLANIDKQMLTDEDLLIRERCEGDLHEFIRHAWPAVAPNIRFIDGWHIGAGSEHLMAVYNGQIETLLINWPSGYAKSSVCNVFFPAWGWCREPFLKFLNVSGTYSLSERDTLLCRQLVQSPWYQKLWGNKVQISKDLNTKERYANTAGGVKIIKTIGGTMGERAHFATVDDANGTDDIYYSTHREYINAGIDSTVSTRIDKISENRRGGLIIIQQRVHQFDLTGHWLAKNDKSIVHLMLPAYYESARKCVTIPLGANSNVPWSDPRTVERELLWPQMKDINDVKRIELSLGTEINRQAQLQQNPTPAGGNLIKKEWFKLWKHRRLPECKYIIQSWDTALSVSEDACESAHTTWGLFEDENSNNNIMLLSCWSGKLANPDLRKMMIKCANNYYTRSHTSPASRMIQPDIILIEEAMNGKALIDDLRYSGVSNVIGFNPKTHGFKLENGTSPTKKLARTHFASMVVETQIVWLPMIPESDYTKLYDYADGFLQACLRCPRGQGQDLIDSMAQAFIYMRMNGLIHYKGEADQIDLEMYREALEQQINCR